MGGSINIATNDIVIMCNGKKVKTIKDLNAALDAVEVGESISFGIKRGKEMFISTFPKNDSNSGGNMMMMTTTMDSDGGDNVISIMKDGVELKDVVMLEAGMILKDIDDQTNILAVLPNLESIVKGNKPQEGDIIVAYNGEKNLSSKEINKKYNKAKIGDKITMTLLRDSKKIKISFAKPEVDNGAEIIIEK